MKGFRCIAFLAVVSGLLLGSGSAHATAPAESESAGITFQVEEKEALYTKHYLHRYVVPDVLGYDRTGKPYLKLDAARNAEHKAIVDLLAPGIGFDRPEVRDEIAALLHGLPAACKQRSELVLKLNPIEDIDRWVPNVTDNRRITIVAVNGCAEPVPKACRYCLCQEGGYDFPLGSLKRVLRDCSDALHEVSAEAEASASR
ncbi:hypothetical protein [Blastomonas sp.]|uniref:hypothetical protein n=1 Tax=Blastomonas sp. TaxID=1909299 RepID=UPI003593C311